VSHPFREWIGGLFGRRRVTGPVPLTTEPEFECWFCRAVLPKPGVACPSCGEPPPTH
jgi:hypothetical protein